MTLRFLSSAVLLFVLCTTRCVVAQCLEWSQLATPAQPPTWSMELVYDRARHLAVGLVGSHPQIQDRVVLYRFNAPGWNPGWTQVPYGGVAPLGPRFSFASCYHPVRQTVMLYGGYTGIGGGATAANDLWEWNGLAWTRIQHPGAWPPATGNNFMVYDPGRQRLIVLIDDPNPTGLWYTWEWTGSSWEAGQTLGPIYGGSAGVSFCFDEFRGVGFVYCLDSAGFWEEVWEYTPGATAAQGAWNQVAISGPAYQGYEIASLVYDPYRRQVVRHGGRASGSLYAFISGTSVWDPDRRKWDLVAFMPDPQRRGASGACFDTDLDRLLLYGGARQDSGTPPSFIPFHDTWSYVNQSPGIVVDTVPSANWCAGSNGVLSVSVAGSAQVQWWKDNQPIPGATSTILVVSPVTGASAGVYECEVANSCGGLWSRPCTVSVTQPPAITSQPIGQDRCPGEDVLIVGPGVSGTNPEIKLQWDNFGFWMNVPYQYNPVGNFYILPNAQNNQSGWYRFEASNSCGVAHTQPFHIQVGVMIYGGPVSADLDPCVVHQYSVTAQGVGPTLTYEWRRDGVAIVDDGRITGAATPTLTINGVRYQDEGKYECRVTDACESRMSGAGWIRMKTPKWVLRTSSGPHHRFPTSTDMVYDASRGVSVLYGGSPGGTAYLDDTWEWDGHAWTRRFPPANPGARSNHEMVYDSLRQRVLLFGGSSLAHPYNSHVWAYDGSNWTLLTTSPNGPPPGSGVNGEAAFDPVRDRVILTTSVSGNWTNETWEFDPVTLGWQRTNTGAGPYPALSQVVWDDSLGAVLGPNSYPWPGTTWKYQSPSWVTIPTATLPRPMPAVAFDAFRDRLTMFGCCRDTQSHGFYHTDTYGFDGAAWELVLPEFHPTLADALWPAAMCFDSRRNAMVVIGNSYNTFVGSNPVETWEYSYADKVVFDRQPEDQPLVIGANAQFRVLASAAGTPTYQWLKGTIPLVNGPIPKGGVISGAQTNTLTITGLTAANAGEYRCEVSNACGSALSDPAQLGSVCYPDCNGDGALSVGDFGCFQTSFITGNPYADCNQDGALTISDFGCFQSRYIAGCP